MLNLNLIGGTLCPNRKFLLGLEALGLFSQRLMASLMICAFVTTSSTSAAAQTWTQKQSFPGAARNGSTAFVIDGYAYVGLGKDDSRHYSDFYRYNPTQDSWDKIPDFPGGPRATAVSFVLNGKGYVGIGDTTTLFLSRVYYKDFWCYDPQTNTWAKVADFGGSARSSAVSFAVEGKGYVGMGGDAGSTKPKDFWRYDPAGNKWESLGNAPMEARTSATAFALGGKGYVTGGVNAVPNSTTLHSDVHEYDPMTNKWTRKVSADFSLLFTGASAFVLNNEAYICYGTTAKMAKYNPSSNMVTDLGNPLQLGDGRANPVAFAVNGKGYLMLGYQFATFQSYYTKECWEYAPLVGTGSEPLPESEAQLLPSGSPGVFRVSLNQSSKGPCSMRIFDLNGRILHQIASVQHEDTADLTQLPSGTYMVLFEMGGQKRTQKIVFVRE